MTSFLLAPRGFPANSHKLPAARVRRASQRSLIVWRCYPGSGAIGIRLPFALSCSRREGADELLKFAGGRARATLARLGDFVLWLQLFTIESLALRSRDNRIWN